MRFHSSAPQNDGQNGHKKASGPISPGERMIQEHGMWLTMAMRVGFALPRIPVRRVSDGGFSRLMAAPAGRYRAERWWESALERLPD